MLVRVVDHVLAPDRRLAGWSVNSGPHSEESRGGPNKAGGLWREDDIRPAITVSALEVGRKQVGREFRMMPLRLAEIDIAAAVRREMFGRAHLPIGVLTARADLRQVGQWQIGQFAV